MAKKTAKKKPVPRTAKKESTSKAVSIVKHDDNRLSDQTLSLANPNQIMGFSKILKNYIKENNLSVVIQGNHYAMVDGWKFAGANFGLTSLPEDPIAVHRPGQYITILFKVGTFYKMENGLRHPYEKEYAFFVGYMDDRAVIEEMKARNAVSREVTRPYFSYFCKTVIVRLSDGMMIGKGSALCSNLELKKAEFDEYSIQSMSQTRSIGKGYRNLIGYVMKAAGIEPTPAEEMPDPDQQIGNQGTAQPSKKTNPVPQKPRINDVQFDKVMKRVQKGEKGILKSTRDAFVLSPEQDTALQKMFDTYCK